MEATNSRIKINSRSLTKEEIEERKKKVLMFMREKKENSQDNKGKEELPWAKRNGIEMSDLPPKVIEENRKMKVREGDKYEDKGGGVSKGEEVTPIKIDYSLITSIGKKEGNNGKTKNDAPLKIHKNPKELLGKLRSYEDKLDAKITPYLRDLDNYTSSLLGAAKSLYDKAGLLFKKVPGNKPIKTGALLTMLGLAIAGIATQDRISKYFEGIITKSDKTIQNQSPNRSQIPNHSKLEQTLFQILPIDRIPVGGYKDIGVEKNPQGLIKELYIFTNKDSEPIPFGDYLKEIKDPIDRAVEKIRIRSDLKQIGYSNLDDFFK